MVFELMVTACIITHKNHRGQFGMALFENQAAARQMRAQGQGGRIVLMSSVSGHQAVKYLSAYGMTKAALEMLARNLADDPQYETSWGRILPTQRVFLLSPASGQITIIVDGGWSAISPTPSLDFVQTTSQKETSS